MADQDILSSKSSTGLEPNLAALLCYTFIGGIVFWLIEKQSSYVRFHAMQGILLGVAWIVLSIVIGFLWFIPFLGWLIILVVRLLMAVVSIMMMVKAYQGERYKLPVIGDIAERQASGV